MNKKTRQQIGGSYAPPIDEQKLDRYEDLAKSCEDRRIREQMFDLIKMVRVFRETPESSLEGSPHAVIGTVVPLEESEVERIFDHVPYSDECDLIQKVFDELPHGAQRVNDPAVPKGYRMEVLDQDAWDRRNGAYHLLWYARELAMDREPITQDRLPK